MVSAPLAELYFRSVARVMMGSVSLPRVAAERKRNEYADLLGAPKHVKHASQTVDGLRGLLRVKREAMMADVDGDAKL